MNLLESIGCLKALSKSQELYESPKLRSDLIGIVSLLSEQNKEIQRLRGALEKIADISSGMKLHLYSKSDFADNAGGIYSIASEALEQTK